MPATCRKLLANSEFPTMKDFLAENVLPKVGRTNSRLRMASASLLRSHYGAAYLILRSKQVASGVVHPGGFFLPRPWVGCSYCDTAAAVTRSSGPIQNKRRPVGTPAGQLLIAF